VSADVRLVTCAQLPAPDPDTPLLADALATRGVRVDIADWRSTDVNWSDAPVTIIRSPWDYVDDVDAFTGWIRRTGDRTALWNPPELLEWNVHKSYLLDVAARGAPVVPTVVLLRDTAASLDAICDARGWNAVVVKPAVGVGGIGSGRFDVGDPRGQALLDDLLTKNDVLVQPFVASIETDGELSVVVFDGAVSHGLHKSTADGEYRVHEEYGGRTTLAEPPDAAAELAARVFAVLPVPAMYARIDLLRTHGLWQVLEVEATEPSLWLDLAPPAATERFADAVMARLG
jgi:glutathione synthase/RimK-type ligase-like ATP-grasp enzyme